MPIKIDGNDRGLRRDPNSPEEGTPSFFYRSLASLLVQVSTNLFAGWPDGRRLTPEMDDRRDVHRKGWTTHVTRGGRLYYLNHDTKISSWLPPADSWDSGDLGLPYGWESAIGKDGKTYFINHINKTTTYEDPRKGLEDEEPPPQPREVELQRAPELGFGFVAGSEKPVVVRFVTEGGPSEHKLLPGDQILMIDGKDVQKAPRENVIELVRSCKHSVTLTVCQPYATNKVRRSALLTATKKAKLKNHPSRVRFAEGVVINGSPLYSSSPLDPNVPFMPNVLKVFLENGQTRSFKYDSTTSVQDVLHSLTEKLSIQCPEYFSLEVENYGRAAAQNKRRRFCLLEPQDLLAKIAARPGAHHLKCHYRLAFPPKDAYDLLKKDSSAFDYFYIQCCNDVVNQRLSQDIKLEVLLRLAALHIQQHSLDAGQAKVSIKAIEKECGLERFLPGQLLLTMKKKELRKLLAHFTKQNLTLCPPGQKQLTTFQAKLHYLKIVRELPGFGAKYFPLVSKDPEVELTLLVGQKYGLTQISSNRGNSHLQQPQQLCALEEICSLQVSREDEYHYSVEVQLLERESLVFILEDIDELVLFTKGCCRVETGKDLEVQREPEVAWRTEKVPCYTSQHMVREAPWNYPSEDGRSAGLRSVDLAVPPPHYMPFQAKYSQNGSIDSGNPPTPVDHNMNETHPLSQRRPDFPSLESGIDFQSVVSAEILEEDPEPLDLEMFETKNEAVLNRISEMNKIVTESEMYLSDERPEDEEAQGEDLEPGGPLRATDSLLLLTQVDEIDMKPKTSSDGSMITLDVSPSESDAESTPTDSPLHRGTPARNSAELPQQRSNRRDSSFGLLSPDMVPGLESGANADLMDLLRKLKDAAELELPYSDTSLYLDPDIIDLTLLPPPSTPDELSQIISPVAKEPPHAFFDSQYSSDEHSYLGEVPPALSIKTDDEDPASSADSARVVAALDNLCDALSVLQAINTTDNLPHTPPLVGGDLTDPFSLIQSSAYLPQDVTEDVLIEALSSDYQDEVDIDKFIASVTVPPPPAVTDDIAAFIIPPPPSSSPIREVQDEVMARFRQASADIQRIMSNDGNTTAQPPKFCTDEEYELWSKEQEHVSNGVEHSGEDTPGYDTLRSSVISYGDGHPQDEAINRNLRVYDNEVWNETDNSATLPSSQNSSLLPSEVPLSRVSRSLSWTNMMDPRKPPLPPSSPLQGRSRRSSTSSPWKQSATTSRSGTRSSRENGNSFSVESPDSIPNLARRNSLPRLLNGCNSISPFCSSSTKEEDGISPCNGHNVDHRYYNGTYHTDSCEEKTFNLAQKEILSLTSQFSSLEKLRHSLDIEREAGKFDAARDSLIVEARKFVTSSKLFVKSAMESSDKMLEHLRMCMVLLDRVASVSEMAVVHMPSSEGISGLVERLRAVTTAFSHTVEAARCTLGKGIINPHMGELMHRATTLATALTALMRTLRNLHTI